MLYKNNLIGLLFFGLLFSSCQLPPAAYILNTPLAFSCSTDYDPTVSNPEVAATWKMDCQNTPNTWIKFTVFASQTDISGFLFYKEVNTNTPYTIFQQYVQDHIKNGVIDMTKPYIVSFIANNKLDSTTNACSSLDPSGQDRGQTLPSLYLNNPIQYTPPSPTPTYNYAITGLDGITSRETSVILPPLTCLGTGAFVVTTVDYTNKAESQASNILILRP